MDALRDRVAFDAPLLVPDGLGGEVNGFTDDVYQCRAQFIYSGGGEQSVAGDLRGQSTYKLKIAANVGSKQITTDWRMRDRNRTTEYNIVEIDAITQPGWIYMVVKSGVVV